MSRGKVEVDFLGLEQKQTTNNVHQMPKFKKSLDRRRSFRDIQGAISKIDPEIIKSLLASGPDRSLYGPSTPKEDHSNIHKPLSMTSTEVVSGNVPTMSILYNGTVSVFQVPCNKAEDILKVATMETAPKNKDLSVITPTALRPKLFGKYLDREDIPIARRKSLQTFFQKRKERLTSTSPRLTRLRSLPK